uniref:Uncharacterized protein n=1 Tax=Zea mays TaxID=4577 RepID=B6TYT7_MAIZE|nr:hypothetical protein [Zea mays]
MWAHLAVALFMALAVAPPARGSDVPSFPLSQVQPRPGEHAACRGLSAVRAHRQRGRFRGRLRDAARRHHRRPPWPRAQPGGRLVGCVLVNSRCRRACGWRAWRDGALLITCILYVVVVVSREGTE